MISEDSLIFLANHVGGKSDLQAAVEIAEVIGAGLAMAEALDDCGEDGLPDPAEARAMVDRFHRATTAFFLIPPTAPTPP